MLFARRRRLAQPFVLYSRADCSLCAAAERETVRVVGRDGARVVDIVGNRELEDAFVFRIPVLAYRDVVLAEGVITAAEVSRALVRARRIDREGATRA